MKTYGLIGFPLSHSFSKNYFNDKFKLENIDDCRYKNFPIQKIEEVALLLQQPEICGLNVTIPYKEKVIPFLTDLDTEAREIGAINCIKIYPDKSTRGFNTDFIGFHNSIKPFLQSHHTHALILGTGGASRAVAHVLTKLGIVHYFVTSKSEKKIENCFTYDELNEHIIKHFKFIINTTPLGTSPDVDLFPPIPYQHITADHFLYDLVYNPAETVFLNKGKNAGAIIQNGLSMLKHQAEKAWQIWNDPLL